MNPILQSGGDRVRENLAEGSRLLYVDVAKCVALAFIVVCHTEWSYMISFVDNMALPVFWICSGFTTRPDFSIRRKAATLLKPYLILSGLCLIFTLLLAHGRWSNAYLTGFLYSRWKLFDLPLSESNPAIMTMHNSVLWFLTSMFTAFCLLKLLFLTARSFKAQMLSLLFLLLIQWVFSFFPLLLPWSLDTAPFVASLMLIGHWLRKHRFFERKDILVWVVICGLVYIPTNWLSGPTNYSIREMGEWWPASFACGVTGTIVLLYICRLIGDNSITRFLAMLNRQALYIFGLQLVFIALSAYATTRLPEIPILKMTTTVAICFAGGCISGYIISQLYMRTHEPCVPTGN